jgi:arylsulfatase A-like enzyme
MFTGLDPTRHGAVPFSFVPLSYDLDTLAELLWDRGYETAGFVGGGFVADYFGLGQGFERFWENPAGKGEADTLQAVVDLAKPWMEERRGSPFFLFLHTYQVHLPYTPSAPALARFADPAYDGPYQTRFLKNDAGKLMKTRRFEPPILQHLNALYDGEILDMDTGVKDLLDFLRTSGLDRNTCVLFTSDHGEEFGEHGDIQHAYTKLYEELIHVPLIVWCAVPRRADRFGPGIAHGHSPHRARDCRARAAGGPRWHESAPAAARRRSARPPDCDQRGGRLD